MNLQWRRRLLIIGLLALLCGGFVLVTTDSAASPRPSYNQFIAQVGAGQIAAVTMAPQKQEITVRTEDGSTYRIGYPEAAAEQMVSQLQEAEVPLEVIPIEGSSWWASLLAALIPLALIILLFGFLTLQLQGGGQKVLGLGRSGAREVDINEAPTVTFRDVAGAAEAVAELREIRDFLASPDKFRALGARIPRGVLLSGPPGTGKTLLARAVAGEAGTPFYSISGSDFVEMFVGVGASRVRDLFARAQQNGPCIIFIDEIDAVGRQRGSGMGGGHDEREQTLNQLLVEMDGFERQNATIVIAATNRPDILDPALLRPGRFDRRVVVDRPDRAGRAEILLVHARGKPLGHDVDLERLAAQTPGLVGADLANLVNEAALLAARRGSQRIFMADLEEAIMRTVAGPERKSRVLSREERETTAFHEMGHALVGHLLADADPVHKISIVSRGQALGYTISTPDNDISLMRRAQLSDRMAMILGGRVAEQLVFDELTSGAANDLERVTDIAHQMVTRLGMSEAIGPRVVGGASGSNWWDHQAQAASSEGLAELIDSEIGRLVREAEDRAREILSDQRSLLDRLARILLDQETIDREQFLRLVAGEDQAAVFGVPGPVVAAPERPMPAPARGRRIIGPERA